MTDTIIEAAVQALLEVEDVEDAGLDQDELARRVVTAVAPLIEAQALERAAKIVEAYTAHPAHAADVAARIRALKEQP
jgi:hypothetical protein